MAKKQRAASSIEAWTLDQLAKSAFFHRKLHEWKLIEIADEIEIVQGENLNWDDLHISEQAWNKIIHRGIKPVTVFVHPQVIQTIAGSIGYYRMLAMVSQKSMKNIGISLDTYESGKVIAESTTAITIARHLNRLVSALIEADEQINAREFDLWRGMAAGSQAQGSWQNNKGSAAEIAIREIVLRRLQERDFIVGEMANKNEIVVGENRVLIFASEPDIAVYQNAVPQIAVEIKGGIDPAAVLERVGAAVKSLARTREENPASITVLILQDVSMTERAKDDLRISAGTITYLFSASSILENETERERFFQILGI